jgi:hypothetical protein
MDKKITVRIQRNFGTDHTYPVCPAAKLFAEIANQKTLSQVTLKLIRELGYEITTISAAV